MGMAREFGAIASFPYSQTDKRFFVAGGFGLNKAEIAYSGGWGATADIPVTVNFHCVVSFNSTTFLLIGGYQVTQYDHMAAFKKNNFVKIFFHLFSIFCFATHMTNLKDKL